jgi:hypothetical protein
MSSESAREASRRWREKNPGYAAKKVAEWREANPDKVREQWKRQAARRSAKGPRVRSNKTPCIHCGGMDRMPSGHCRPCHAESNRQRALKYPERVRELARARSKRWRDRMSPDRKREQNRRGNLGVALRTMGLTREQYDQMVVDQNNQCAICSASPKGRFKHLSIDHCHNTGRVRGLLCATCNLVIGQMNDDPTRLQQAIEYLNKHKDTT